MSSTALFNLLPDFGAAPPRSGATGIERIATPPPAAPAIDIDAAIARAVTEAEAALTARLELAHEEAMEAERRRNAEEAQAFLASLGDDVGKTIAGRIDRMQAEVGDLVGTAVARIVGNLLGEDLQKRSLEALSRAIAQSIGDTDAVRIQVRGPQSMYETLRASLGPHAQHLDYTDAPGFDLTVAIDDAVFETRMAEWAGVLSGVLP